MRFPQLAIGVAVALLLASCSGTSAAECRRTSRDLVDAIQRYVDAYGKITPAKFATDAEAPSPRDLAVAVARYRERLRLTDCDASQERDHLVADLATLRGDGVVGGAIAASLRESLTRAARFGGEAPRPETITVTTKQDLATAIVGALPGSTVVLARGTHRLTTPLVLLDEITIRGSGRDRTRVLSSAPGASVLFLSTGTLTLERLTVGRSGRAAATGIVVRAGSYVIRDARISGARRDRKGTGGAGLVVGAVKSQDKDRTMRIERTDFRDNETSGITVGGTDAPTIARITVSGSESCGVCYIAAGAGTLRDSRLTDNTTGVTVLGTAGPTVRGNVFTSNRIGLQARGRAKPAVLSSTFRANRDAAMVFTERATGRARGNECSGGTFGIVVIGSAKPSLANNRCTVFDG